MNRTRKVIQAKNDCQINPDASCKFGHFWWKLIFCASFGTFWMPITQKLYYDFYFVSAHCAYSKCIILKLSKISIQNFDSINWRLEWRLCWNFTSPSFILSEKKTVKECYGQTGLVHRLNDSDSPKMVIKLNFNFFRFFS